MVQSISSQHREDMINKSVSQLKKYLLQEKYLKPIIYTNDL